MTIVFFHIIPPCCSTAQSAGFLKRETSPLFCARPPPALEREAFLFSSMLAKRLLLNGEEVSCFNFTCRSSTASLVIASREPFGNPEKML